MATVQSRLPSSVASQSSGVDENTAASFTPTSPKKRKHDGHVKLTDRRPPKEEKVTCAEDGCDTPASPLGNHMGSLVKCRVHAIPGEPKLKRTKSMHLGLNRAGDPADEAEKYFFGLNQEEAIQLFQNRWGDEDELGLPRTAAMWGTRSRLLDHASAAEDNTLITLIMKKAGDNTLITLIKKKGGDSAKITDNHKAAKVVIMSALRHPDKNHPLLESVELTDEQVNSVLSTVRTAMHNDQLTEAEREYHNIKTPWTEADRQRHNHKAKGTSQPQLEWVKEPGHSFWTLKPQPAGDDDSGNDTESLDNNDGDVTESDEDQFNACMTDDCPNGAGDSQFCHDCREDAKVAHAESYTEIDESQRQ